MDTAPSRQVVITVHGTFDNSDNKIGSLWWQIHGPLFKLLHSELSKSGVADLVGFVPFSWCGNLRESARLDAAFQLQSQIESFSDSNYSVHLVAHSHGGNIVRTALSILRTRPDVLERVRSVTTVGTPYIRYNRLERILGAWKLYLTTTILFALALSIARLASGEVAVGLALLTMNFAGVGATVSALYVVHCTRHRDFLGPPSKLTTDWRCFFSRTDEAIHLLRTICRPMPSPASTSRSFLSFSFGDFPFRLGHIPIISAAAYGIVVCAPIALVLTGGSINFSVVLLILANVGILFLLPPARTVRAISLAASMPSKAATALAMRIARRQLINLAFGDDNQCAVDGVGLVPWPTIGQEVPCNAGTHDSLERDVQKAFVPTWAEFRARLGSADNDLNWRDLIGAMSWDALAHTAYFQNAEFLSELTERLLATIRRHSTLPPGSEGGLGVFVMPLSD